MHLFKYKAVRKDGTEYTNTFEAPDKFALYKELQSKGDTIVFEKEIKQGGVSAFLHRDFGSVKTEHIILFAKNLSAMLAAGLPLSRALAVIARQVSNKRMTKSILSIIDSLNTGLSLSQSIRAFPAIFSKLFVSMVAVGEESGNLSQSLKLVAEQLEKTHQLKKKVKGAMMYPGIIFSVMVVIAILMFIFVVPSLTNTFREFNVDLPLSTRFVIGVSDAFQNHLILMILGFVGLTTSLVVFLRTTFGRSLFHRVILKIPVIGLITQHINSARVARTLSSLLSSGVDMLTAMTIVSEVVQNVHYQKMLTHAIEQVQKGVQLAPLFFDRPDLYPSFVGEMVAVGDETGTLSRVLFETAVFYENEVEQKTKDLSTIIEPLLMVVIGAAVGFFALAMIAPIYSLSSVI